MKSIDINLLEIVWQVFARNIDYEAMVRICQSMIKNTERNQTFSQYLIFLLYKSFYQAQNKIASKCREKLIKQSIMTLYRGVITYQPAENDYKIKNLENKIQSLIFNLKDIDNIKLNNQKKFALHTMEEVLTESSQLNNLSFQKNQEYVEKLIEEAEKHCNTNCYKTMLRDKENGLIQVLHDIFFAEIEDNNQFNSVLAADLLPLKDTATIKTNNSSKYHILKKLDGKLFTAPIKPIQVKPGTSWKKLRHQEKATHDIQDVVNPTPKLKKLPSHLSPEMLEQALCNACDIESDLWRAKKLGELAPHLSPKLLEQAFYATREIKSELWRANVLGELAAHLSPELLEQAFYDACDIKSELWRAKGLSKLAPYLTPKLLEQALEAAHGIQSEYNRTRAIEELTPHLSSKQ